MLPLPVPGGNAWVSVTIFALMTASLRLAGIGHDTQNAGSVVYWDKGITMPNNIDAVRAELDALTKIMVETVPVEQVYLFGSYAYGTPHTDSDLDLYVVFKDDSPLRFSTQKTYQNLFSNSMKARRIL
jgi:predicted nucleotidyltransferase